MILEFTNHLINLSCHRAQVCRLRNTPSCEVTGGCSNICGFHGRDCSTSKSWDVIFWTKQRIGTWKWKYDSPNERKPIENILYFLRFLSEVHASFGIPSSPNLSLHESTVPPFERTTPPNEQKPNERSERRNWKIWNMNNFSSHKSRVTFFNFGLILY